MEFSSKEITKTGSDETRVHPAGGAGLIAIWLAEQSNKTLRVKRGDMALLPT
jgi:hypothetical protein